MNKVIFMGRIATEPEVRYSQAGDPIAQYNLAVPRMGQQREGEPNADFFRCVAFKRNAEFVQKYLHKGQRILVEGSLRNNSYTDNNGNKVTTIQVLVSSHEFAESKNASQNAPAAPQSAGQTQQARQYQGTNQAAQRGQQRPQQQARQVPLPPEDEFVPAYFPEDADLPF